MSLASLSAAEATQLLKKNIGNTITLTADYMTFPAKSEWLIKSVNNLGGTCVVAVSPPAGGKGFFAPYKHFSMDLPTAEPEPAPAVEVPAVVSVPDPLRPRNEFSIEGFEPDAPLYELFAAVAPDTDSAKELFLTYAAEHSEFDTEFFDELMRAANVRPLTHWSDTNVTQMLMLMTETQAAVSAPEEAEEDEYGPTVAARMKKMLAEQPASESAPEPKPAVTIHPDVKPYEVPRKRGRPPGAKNKAKEADVVPQSESIQPAMTALDEEDLAEVLDNLPPAAVVVEPDHVIHEAPEQVRHVVIHPKAYKLAAAVLADLGHDSDASGVIDDMVIVLRRALGL